MTNNGTQPQATTVRASQYGRVSDEAQQCLIVNQKNAIQEYADRHHIVIVKSYADARKTPTAFGAADGT